MRDRSIPPMVSDEPPGFQVHVHTGAGFITHHAPLPWQGRELDLSAMLAAMGDSH